AHPASIYIHINTFNLHNNYFKNHHKHRRRSRHTNNPSRKTLLIMHLKVASLALLLVSITGMAAAQDDKLIRYGICTCFRPKYDASCCILARGSMSGNVCDTPDFGSSVDKYRACCKQSGGEIKCKTGYRDPKNPWPPEGSYGCNIKH
ncbi:hypothetical protein BGZ91_002800, partial [Linnemannia elongata]